jgi:hypothetical protein
VPKGRHLLAVCPPYLTLEGYAAPMDIRAVAGAAILTKA